MNAKSLVTALVLAVTLAGGSHAAENLVAHIERCSSATGFSGSLYAVSPGDKGVGHNIRFRVRNGDGFYMRDNVYNEQQKAYLWHDWIQVPPIMATKEGRRSLELRRPVVRLSLDVSIDGRTITGSAEHLDDSGLGPGETHPRKIKLSCLD